MVTLNDETSKGINDLARAIEKLHAAKASFLVSEPVHQRFRGVSVWHGVVSTFELKEHPSATKCYAWSVPPEDGGQVRFYAVLHVLPVDSPVKAVRASLVADSRALF